MSTINKAVIYVRVSSKEQEREGYSIPAQKKFLHDYAHNKSLKVVKVFEESESAKIAGRTNFKSMLQYLKEHPDVCHILVEKTDRLYRNLQDYIVFDPATWPHLQIHLAKENEILSQESKSHQKFIHGIKVLIAKNYSDNLSEEARKGMTEKASQGLYPSCAPIGYINNKTLHTIEQDPQKAHLIKKGFELASSGQHSLSNLKKILYTHGLRSARAKNEISKSQLQRILSNPIYYGDFIWKGQYYKGNHKPIVTKQLFDKVQEQMGFVKRSKMTKYNFAFMNTMTCGHCGCAITAQEKRKKSGRTYVYYHCTSGKGDCEGVTYIREEKLENWFTEALIKIQIPDEIVEWTKTALLESHKDEQSYRQQQMVTLESRFRTLQTKIEKAYEDKLEGSIDTEFWQTQNSKWRQEQTEIESQLASLRSANTAYIDQGVKLIELARQAPMLFKSMTNDEKRELVNLVLSNPRIENGTLRYDYRKPFNIVTEATTLEKWRGKWDEFRTFCIESSTRQTA